MLSVGVCASANMCNPCVGAEPPARPAGAGSGDEVSAALERLTAHAGNAKKFRKVAELATQLLADGQLARKHGKAVFQARKAANAVLGLLWTTLLTPTARVHSSWRRRWRTRRA